MSHKLCFVLPDHRMSTSHSLHYDTWVRNCQTACILHELCAGYTLRCIRMTRFGPKVSQIGSKLDKSGTFSYQISVRIGSSRSEKVPDFSHLGPIWPILGPNLTPLACFLLNILTGIDNIAYRRHAHDSLLPSLLSSQHIVQLHTPDNFTYLSWAQGGEVMRVPL